MYKILPIQTLGRWVLTFRFGQLHILPSRTYARYTHNHFFGCAAVVTYVRNTCNACHTYVRIRIWFVATRIWFAATRIWFAATREFGRVRSAGDPKICHTFSNCACVILAQGPAMTIRTDLRESTNPICETFAHENSEIE